MVSMPLQAVATFVRYPTTSKCISWIVSMPLQAVATFVMESRRCWKIRHVSMPLQAVATFVYYHYEQIFFSKSQCLCRQ